MGVGTCTTTCDANKNDQTRSVYKYQQNNNIMEVVVLLGRRADDPIPTFLLSICPSIIITLYVSSRSRIVWRELEPCLLGRCSSRRIASGDDDDDSSKVARRRMLLCILSHYYHNCYKPTNSSTVVIEETLKEQETNNQQCRQENDDDDGSKNQFQLCHHKRRRIRLGQKLLDRVLPSSSSVSYPSQKLYLYIQPPRTTSLHFEYLWENKLIHLEHKLILATSMAGLYSTLGGGCFMTRRMSTAILLARQQQRMALILNVSLKKNHPILCCLAISLIHSLKNTNSFA